MDIQNTEIDSTMRSPGSLVREGRQAREMTLKELAAATRIPRATIAHIEDNAFEELPAEVFVRGFLRNLARELGLPQHEVIDSYELYTGKIRNPAIAPIADAEEAPAQEAQPSPLSVWADSVKVRIPSFDHVVEYVGSARPSYVIGTLVLLLGIAVAVSVVASSLDRAPELTLNNVSTSKASWNVKADGSKARWILDGQSNVHNGVVNTDAEADTKVTRAE